MPVKTVTILVQALTDKANAEIKATGAVFDELRRKSPVEMQVKFDKAQAIAESRITARLMSQTVRDVVKLQADGGGGLISRLFGGGGGGGGGGLISKLVGGSIPLPGPLPAIPASPAGLAGGAVAALAALPFLAQAAATGITLALGGALTGIGVYAEHGVRSVQYQFAQLVSGKNGIQATLANISPAFGVALTTILSSARTFIPQFIRMFGPALNAIAGPLQAIGVMITGSLASPAVAGALQAVGKAFGSILTAVTPQIPGDINAIANGITATADAIKKNPKPFADFIWFLVHIVSSALIAIAWLTNVADYLETHFLGAFRTVRDYIVGSWDKTWAQSIGAFITFNQRMGKEGDDLRHHIANVFDGVRHDVASAWDLTWNETVGRFIRFNADWNRDSDNWRHDIAAKFDSIRHDIASAWDTIWNNTIGRIKHGISDAENLFAGIPHLLLTKLSGLGQDLWNFMANAMNMFLQGAEHVLSDIANFFTSLPKKILHWLGINSPPDWAFKAGEEIINGITGGMARAHQRVKTATQAIATEVATHGGHPGPGGGAPAANAALARALYPAWGSGAEWAAWNNVAMAESGWNQYADNPSSGAYGIAQALPPTKYPFAGQAAGGSNPTAQITWMVDYILSRYGDPIGAWAHEQAFHWYDQGGILPPGLSLAMNTTGRAEVLSPGGMGRVEALLEELCDLLAANNELTAAAPARTGAGLGAALAGGARTATYRALYS